MTTKGDSGYKVAEFLLQIKAIQFRPEHPYVWASGWKSPIYCDSRKTLSFPKVRTHIRQLFVQTILDNFGKPEVIAGVDSGGIAMGILVAQEFGVPFICVKPEGRSGSAKGSIEGAIEPGRNVILVEDLVSTGKSSLSAVQLLRASGYAVKGMVSIFSYGLAIATQRFSDARCDFISLTDYDTLLNQALQSDYISTAQLESLQEWRQDPESWSIRQIGEPSNP